MHEPNKLGRSVLACGLLAGLLAALAVEHPASAATGNGARPVTTIVAPGGDHHGATVRPFVSALTTYVAPAEARWGDRTVDVVVSTDGRIFYDWWDLGGGPHGWTEVLGMHTDAAAAATLVDGTLLYIAVKGTDRLVYLDVGRIGGFFAPWIWTGMSSNVAPGATSLGNRSVLLVTGTDGRIYYDWWDYNRPGSGWAELPGNGITDATAAASLVNGGSYLFVMARGLDGIGYLNQGTLGGSFYGWSWLGVPTNVVGFGASSAGNRSIVVVTGTDGRIYYDYWDLYGMPSQWSEVPGNGISDAAPAVSLVSAGTYAFIMAKGLDDHLYLNQGTPGVGFFGWQ